MTAIEDLAAVGDHLPRASIGKMAHLADLKSHLLTAAPRPSIKKHLHTSPFLASHALLYTRHMKIKTLLIGLTTFALAASTASAANYLGGSVGSGVTLHYQTDLRASSAVRYGLNLTALNFDFNSLSIGGGVDYLTPFQGQNFNGFGPYYGFGLDAGVYLNSANSGVSIYPHGLLGLKYNINAPLSVFVEANAGLNIRVGSGGGAGFGSGARIGLNYRLP
jgi:hypothetical protein